MGICWISEQFFHGASPAKGFVFLSMGNERGMVN